MSAPAFTEHPQAEILRWIADGFDIQTRCNFDGELSNIMQVTDWKDTEATTALCYIAASARGSVGRWEFRLSPRIPGMQS
jgi:hypothetical protein